MALVHVPLAWVVTGGGRLILQLLVPGEREDGGWPQEPRLAGAQVVRDNAGQDPEDLATYCFGAAYVFQARARARARARATHAPCRVPCLPGPPARSRPRPASVSRPVRAVSLRAAVRVCLVPARRAP
jgi:hypothetical protein